MVAKYSILTLITLICIIIVFENFGFTESKKTSFGSKRLKSYYEHQHSALTKASNNFSF